MPRLSTLISLDAQAALAAAAAPSAANPFATMADVGPGGGGSGSGLVPIAGLVGQPLPNTFAVSDGTATIVLPATAVHNDRAGLYCLTTTQVAPPDEQILYFGDPDTGSVVGPDTITLQAGTYAEWVCCDFGAGETGWLPAGASNEGSTGGGGGGTGLVRADDELNPQPGEYTWITNGTEFEVNVPETDVVGSRFGVFVHPSCDGVLLRTVGEPSSTSVQFGNFIYGAGLTIVLRGGAYYEWTLTDGSDDQIWLPCGGSNESPQPLQWRRQGSGNIQPNEWALTSDWPSDTVPTPQNPRLGDRFAVLVDGEGGSIAPVSGHQIRDPAQSVQVEYPDTLDLTGTQYYEWIYNGSGEWFPVVQTQYVNAGAVMSAIDSDTTPFLQIGHINGDVPPVDTRKQIHGVLDPTLPDSAATKSYVDTAVAGGPGPGGDRTASGIRTATTVVATATAAAPSTGMVLTATGPSAATWQTPAGGGVTFGPATALAVGGANSDGVLTTTSHSDHKHALPAFGTTAGTFAQGSDTRIVNAVQTTSLASGVSTFLTTPTSANLRAAVTDESGTGALIFAGGAIGTPSSATLTNATGLPISTGVSGLGTGVASFLATPSSANLRAAVTDESGTGLLLFQGGALGTPASGTLTGCTGRVGSSQTADRLASSGAGVDIGTTVPTAGQVLTAQSATTCSWVTPSAGGGSPPISTITASTTAVAGTRYLVDSTSGVITVTLPTAASSSGKDITVKRIAGSNSVVIDGAGTDTIDGALTLTLTLGFEWALLTSNGTAWFQLS